MAVLQKLGFLFKRMGFDKSDERSLAIGAYTARAAWLYVTAALIIWTIYEAVRFGRLAVPALLFFTSQTVFWVAMIHYRKKLGG